MSMNYKFSQKELKNAVKVVVFLGNNRSKSITFQRKQSKWCYGSSIIQTTTMVTLVNNLMDMLDKQDIPYTVHVVRGTSNGTKYVDLKILSNYLDAGKYDKRVLSDEV